jgi:hypothetical protein
MADRKTAYKWRFFLCNAASEGDHLICCLVQRRPCSLALLYAIILYETGQTFGQDVGQTLI